MAWNDIGDLYYSTLAADQPLVDANLTIIKDQIESITASNGTFSFEYDLDAALAEETDDRKKRIRDQIVYHLRKDGISVAPTNTSNLLQISWLIRDDHEYMRTYY